MEVELVPSTVWFSSLYRLLSREAWNGIRDGIIGENGRKCQICGEIKGRMNLHEVWKYDDKKHVQKLEGFILLCEMCHHIKHLGLAGILANERKLDYNVLIKHFCRINECRPEDFDSHRDFAFEVWRKRSQHQWKQDFGKYVKLIRSADKAR